MARIYQVKDPSNNALNDIPLEDNAVLLSGYCSELGYISTGKLIVYDGFTLQALYEDDNNGYSSDYFPIGSHIYVYMGNQILTDEEVSGLKVYDSYYNVPLTENGIIIDQGFADNFSDYDAVWLEVMLDSTHTKWYPIGITGTKGLHTKGLYIYLGSYTGDVGGQSQVDADKFMLEVKNEMYFYDSNGFTPFNLWEMNNQIGWIEALLAAI